MKKNKTLVKTQRKSIDEKMKIFLPLKAALLPRSGWIKAVRESLGMTSKQLAERMGIQQSGVILLEKRELDKKVSLETMEKAAQAMGCKFVYALVPQEESLNAILEKQCQRAAREILKRTLHTMELEDQAVGPAEAQLHEDELARELKRKLDSRIWKRYT